MSRPGTDADPFQRVAHHPVYPEQGTTLLLGLRSPQPWTRDHANEFVLPFLFDPPPWVTDEWESAFVIGYLPTPRSKARGSYTRTLTEGRIRGAMRKDWPGGVFSVGFDYVDPSESNATRLGVMWGGATMLEVTGCLPAGAATDPRVGPWVGRTARRVLEDFPRSLPSSAAILKPGHAIVPDLVSRDDAHVPGDHWMVTLSPQVVERLGGLAVVHGAPASIIEQVTTADGEQWVIVVLTSAPREVTRGQVRAWREFLRPVLPASTPTFRSASRPVREAR